MKTSAVMMINSDSNFFFETIFAFNLKQYFHVFTYQIDSVFQFIKL